MTLTDGKNALSASHWQLVSYGTQAGQTLTVPDSQVTLTFDAGNGVSGYAGCNSYSGTYDIRHDRLTFDPLISTFKACDDPLVMAQEAVYLEALQAATRYKISNDELLIESGSGQTLMFLAVRVEEMQ